MRPHRQRLLRGWLCDVFLMNTPAERLKWARKEAGFQSAVEAARSFGWVRSTYLTHENGQRVPKRAMAKAYARAFSVSWEWLLEGGSQPQKKAQRAMVAVPTRGEVAAGRWLDLDADLDADDFEQFPIAPTAGYPIDSQYGLIVRGTSMNRVAGPGDVFHCVDKAVAGIAFAEDDIVIVERRRFQQGQREVTAKRLRKRGNILILAPDSTDPKWRPIELDTDNPPEDEEIALIALVIGKYQPFRKRK